MIKAIIFDMDGLLLDSEPVQYESVVKTLKEFGVNLTEREFVEKIFKEGLGTADILKEKNPDADLEKYRKMRSENFIKMIDEKIRPMPYALEFLDMARESFKTGLVTNTSKEMAMPMLEKFGIQKKMDVMVFRRDYEKRKPDPESYLLAAKKLGVDPSECLVLEDTERGVASAKNAGMMCVAVPTELTKNLDFSRADMTVSNLGEIDPETLKGPDFRIRTKIAAHDA